MAIKRQVNFLGNMRVDVPHLRLLESAVAGDFQSLSGVFMAGERALVASGVVLLDTGMVGQPVSTLILRMASAVLLHGSASEPGAIYTVPSTQPDDTLNAANAAVVGSFSPGVTNYVGINLIRTADATTSDNVIFRSSSTKLEFPQVVPLGRVLNYTINISTNDFGSTPALCPVAKVITDGSNNIVSITDCRQMFFRLGSGGTNPDPLAQYAWANRNEALGQASLFTGGDKDITSQYAFNGALLQRLWELGGGEHWYSPADDRSVRLVGDSTSLPPGGLKNFYWDGTDLLWDGLSFVFGNSTATYNVVAPQIAPNALLTTLIDGDVVYVDLDRTTEGATIQPVKTTRALLFANQSTLPGRRHILAWRFGTEVYTTDVANVTITVTLPIADLITLGAVFLNHTSSTPAAPKVAVVNNSDYAIVSGVDRFAAGALNIGTVTATSLVFAQAGVGAQFAGNLNIVEGLVVGQPVINQTAVSATTSGGGGTGVYGRGGGWGGDFWANEGAGIGVRGYSNNANGIGGDFYGFGFGIRAQGVGNNGAIGIQATGDTSAGIGGQGVVGLGGVGGIDGGVTGGVGVKGTGTRNSPGVYGVGGPTNGHGVWGKGTAVGYGIYGEIAASGTYAVYGTGAGATTDGTGVYGVGKGAGYGVYGLAGAGTGHGVFGDGGTGTGYGVFGFAPVSGGNTLAYAVVGDGTVATTNGTGVYGAGKGTGVGIHGTLVGSGTIAILGDASSGSADGYGVKGIGKGVGAGVRGETGSANGAAGVQGAVGSGATSGTGVSGLGKGTGPGVYGAGGVSAAGVQAVAGTNSANLSLTPRSAAPSAKTEGDVYFDTDSRASYNWDGYRWNQMGDRRIIRTTDQAATNNPALTYSGFQFEAVASGVYSFELTLFVDTSAGATTGWEGYFTASLGLTATVFLCGVSHMEGFAHGPAATAVTEEVGGNARFMGGGINALNTAFIMSTREQTITTLYHLRGTLIANAAGLCSFEFRPRINGQTVTIRAGSHLQWRRHI